MKRQRNSRGDHEGVVAATVAMQEGKSEERKKSKWAAEGREGWMVAAAAAENWVEEWAWLRLSGEGILADEQMSWGYFTLPKWGVEFMVEAYGDLFSDVVWDDDIWNLKSIHEIPANP